MQSHTGRSFATAATPCLLQALVWFYQPPAKLVGVGGGGGAGRVWEAVGGGVKIFCIGPRLFCLCTTAWRQVYTLTAILSCFSASKKEATHVLKQTRPPFGTPHSHPPPPVLPRVPSHGKDIEKPCRRRWRSLDNEAYLQLENQINRARCPVPIANPPPPFPPRCCPRGL